MDYKVDENLIVIFSDDSKVELMPDNLFIAPRVVNGEVKGILKEGVTNSDLLGFYQDITPDGTPYIEFIVQTSKFNTRTRNNNN